MKTTIKLLVVLLLSTNAYAQQQWQGTWNSTFGELRIVAQDQNNIYGDYADTGVLYGYIQRINGEEYFAGTFENYRMNRKGIFKFKIKDARYNNAFNGEWTWSSPTNWSAWNANKSSKRKPSLRSFYDVKGGIYEKGTNRLITGSVTVEVFQDGIRRFYSNTTNGRYTRQLPKGTWELRVSLPDYKPFKSTLVVTSTTTNNYLTANIFLEKKTKAQTIRKTKKLKKDEISKTNHKQ